MGASVPHPLSSQLANLSWAYDRFGSEADIRLPEFGIVAPVGLRGIKALLEVIMDREVDRR